MRAHAFRSLSQAQSIDDRTAYSRHFSRFCRWASGAPVSGLKVPLAGFARVALHAGRNAPLPDRFRAAVAARRRFGELRADQRNNVT
jgi:hypothetical protein